MQKQITLSWQGPFTVKDLADNLDANRKIRGLYFYWLTFNGVKVPYYIGKHETSVFLRLSNHVGYFLGGAAHIPDVEKSFTGKAPPLIWEPNNRSLFFKDLQRYQEAARRAIDTFHYYFVSLNNEEADNQVLSATERNLIARAKERFYLYNDNANRKFSYSPLAIEIVHRGPEELCAIFRK